MKDHDYYESFIAYLLTEKRASLNTVDAYKRDISQLLSFCSREKKSITALEKKDFRTFLAEEKKRGIKARSIARKISSYKHFFSYLERTFKLPDSASSLRIPKIERPIPLYLTEDQVKKLLTTAQEKATNPKSFRDCVMLYLLYAGGLRVSELLKITMEALHFDTGFLQLLGKGKKERQIPLPEYMLKLLRIYCEKTRPLLLKEYEVNAQPAYLFPLVYKKQIRSLSRQLFWRYVKKILMSAGLSTEVSPHTLRHSLATHLLKHGADIRSLQVLLGHENLVTIQIYTHIEKSEIRKVYDKKHPRA